MEKYERDDAGTGSIEKVAVLGGALAIASLGGKDDRYYTVRTNLAEDGKECLHQTSRSINHGTSGIVILEIAINDAEHEIIGVTGGSGDIEEISRPETDRNPMNVHENESNDSLVMETIGMVMKDGEFDADAKRPTAEENSTLQEPSLSSSEEKSSFSTIEEDADENILIQSSSLSTKEEEEEEERHSPTPLSFSNVEEKDYDDDEEEEGDDKDEDEDDEEDDEEEGSPIESPFPEEDSPMESAFSEEEDDDGDDKGEEDEEEDSSMESPVWICLG